LTPGLASPYSSREVTQQALYQFILLRTNGVKKETLNKNIKNMHAFLSWAEKNRYVVSDLRVKKVKVAQKPIDVRSGDSKRTI